MKNKTLFLAIFILLALSATTTFSATDRRTGTQKIDLNGTWNFTMKDNKVVGPCPNGKPTKGKLIIKEDANGVNLEILSGVVCNPTSVCNYLGQLEGNLLTVTNNNLVDDEGGQTTNTIGVTLASATEATGKSSQTYSHPGGMQCDWTSNVMLTRTLK